MWNQKTSKQSKCCHVVMSRCVVNVVVMMSIQIQMKSMTIKQTSDEYNHYRPQKDRSDRRDGGYNVERRRRVVATGMLALESVAAWWSKTLTLQAGVCPLSVSTDIAPLSFAIPVGKRCYVERRPRRRLTHPKVWCGLGEWT